MFKGPRVWWKTIREIVTLERMHRAFDSGLMEYGKSFWMSIICCARREKVLIASVFVVP